MQVARSTFFRLLAVFALTLPFQVTAQISSALQNGATTSTTSTKIQRVLLISIDGMHAVDFLNCANGISTANNNQSYCPAIAALGQTGINYVSASTSKPSDSFPGLTAIVTGGSPALTGVYYDVAYSRNYNAPAKTTGNGVAGAPGLCTPYGPPTGTTTEYEEGIDIDQTKLNGGHQVRRSPTAASTPSITGDCRATPNTAARLFIHGNSSARTASSA